MEDGIDNRNGNAKAQFDEADRRLGVAEARIRSLFANPLANEAVRQSALEDYREARLLWLSADAVLRSTSVIDKPPRQVGRRIVILRGNAHVGNRLRCCCGCADSAPPWCRRTVPKKRLRMARPRRSSSTSSVTPTTLACWPSTPSIRIRARGIVAMVPPTLERYAWRGFDAVLVKPVSIDMIAHAIMGDSGRSHGGGASAGNLACIGGA